MRSFPTSSPFRRDDFICWTTAGTFPKWSQSAANQPQHTGTLPHFSGEGCLRKRSLRISIGYLKQRLILEDLGKTPANGQCDSEYSCVPWNLEKFNESDGLLLKWSGCGCCWHCCWRWWRWIYCDLKLMKGVGGDEIWWNYITCCTGDVCCFEALVDSCI